MLSFFTSLRHPIVQASALTIFLFGFAGAAIAPYLPVVAVRELGFSDRAFAALMLSASVTNVAFAIGIGIISDRFQSYRRPLILVTFAGVLGCLWIWFSGDAVSFALASIGPLALFGATNSLAFGIMRANSSDLKPSEAEDANGLLRLMISLAWVLVPGLTAWMLRGRESMMDAYLISAVAALGCFLTVVFRMQPSTRPRMPAPLPDTVVQGGTGTSPIAPSTGRPDRPIQVRLPALNNALKEVSLIFRPETIKGLIGVALISSVLHVNSAILPLIITGAAKGSVEDLGNIVGMVAAIEVVFMVVWLRVDRLLPKMAALTVGTLLYFSYFVVLSIASAPWHVYSASIIGGIGAAAIIALPIGYLLDLIRDRPGLSASLITVNMFLGGMIGATLFAIGTSIGSYGTAAILGGIAGITGAGILVVVEKRRVLIN